VITVEESATGSQLSMYIEKLRYLPNGASPPRISVEEWPGDVLEDPKSFRNLLLEERPWLPSEGAHEMERLGLL
jgi:hypothetical protein